MVFSDGAIIEVGGHYWMTKPIGLFGKICETYTSVGGGFFTSGAGYASTTMGGFATCTASFVAVAGGGLQNCAIGEYSTVLGGHQSHACGTGSSSVGAHQGQAQGSYVQIIGTDRQESTGYSAYAYYIAKDAGSFRINHPDPAKTDTHLLYHSFVESPTEGDNIYRYEIQTCECKAILELPSYYKFLNKNDQVWVTPVNHFGNAYGIIDQTQSCVSFCSDTDGKYMALIIGTRKDPHAQNYWNGAERIKGMMTHSPDTGLI